MFSKTKRAAILVAASALLATSLGGNIAYADVTANTNDSTATSTTDTSANKNDTNVATATNNSSDTNNQVVTSTTDKTVNNSTNTTNNNTATTQSTYNSIDVSAVKTAMLTELNRLRAQNGLTALSSVGALNNYAQSRTDSFTNTGVDNHAGWNSANMYPYYLDAEENIAQMPYSMLGTTDPTTIAQKITHEFYSEMYDPEPNYGHRKNMLNPYIDYVGIGVSISSNGMVYFSQEMGNDQASHSKYNSSDIYAYYLTNENDYANVSKYDIADTNRTNDDYTSRDNYAVADIRGGVTTKDQQTPVYDRNGNKRTDMSLAPNSSWIADVIAIIDGGFYYHVSNDTFVSANDALPWATFLAGTTVRATTNAKIYDNNGNYTGHTVTANSNWVVDRRATNPTTWIKMYRIGTNAWIQQNELSQN
ncbi:CAP domain-containing protein [Companilactobacillus kimchiensis]|uniref:SCP domain-containing protein n=1 Tax=Companilactobacillus kimchiensis TaxID=993692 RepID=A0A0R2LGA4_9LACO|nr:CAP domain-containing protein [Companilactobacillus kimchiensis]KRO00566.1 hypothetical protein IV57_GL001002 [Companilactobacillus kimchiensis]